MKIAILTSGLLPVPAINGGAVENLIDLYLEYNEQKKEHHISIYSVINEKKNICFINHKTNNNYIFFKTYHLGYKIRRKIFNFLYKKTFYYPTHIEYFLHRVLKQIKKQRFDIILLENRPGYAEKVSLTCPKARIILHLHNDLLGPDTLNATKIKQHISSVITVSHYIKDRVDTIPPLGKTNVCYNGIDLKKFYNQPIDPNIRKNLGLKPSDFVVVFTGRLIKEKGVEELLLGFNQIQQKNIKLLIIGNNFYGNNTDKTTYIKKLQNIAEQNKNRIVFTGHKPYTDIPKLLKSADISVIPSIWEEPFALTCIESMACGLPLIVTNSGGISELINYQCAITLDKTSKNLPSLIAESILMLYNEPQKRQSMSKYSLELSKKFSKENFSKKFFELLTE
ncbi:MAG: glycosyltransferase family 4 protein [Massilibacteroides sp.]|nr:glycosyltransferase family 4 protein [Massilibacteroides sp.]